MRVFLTYFLSIFLVYQVLIGNAGSKWLHSELNEIRQAAEQGDAYAQAYLSLCYIHGEKGLDISLLEARYHAENSTKQFHWLGDFALGYLARFPPLGPDLAKVRSHYLKVFRDPDGRVIKQAALGDPVAAFVLAEILSSEEVKSHLESDLQMASSYYELASSTGYAPASVQYALVLLYNVVAQDDVELNLSKGIKLLQEAVNEKLPMAHHFLGRCYLEGNGVEVDKSMAFIHFQAAANRGYGPSQLLVANFYAQGVLASPDLEEAYRYAQLASDQKIKGADELIQQLDESMNSSVEDFDEQLSESVTTDQDPILTQVDLPDPPDSLDFEASTINTSINKPQEQFRLPPGYGQQPRVPVTSKNQSSAEPAPDNVTNPVSHNSAFAKEDPERAKNSCEEAKKSYWGQGQSVDFIKAARLFKESANLGNAEASRYLGIIFLRGKGTEKDLKQAMYWFEQSAEGGDELAKKNLVTLRSVFPQN